MSISAREPDLASLSKLVDEARRCNGTNQLAEIEEQIDALVFQAYGISSDEADAINSTTQS